MSHQSQYHLLLHQILCPLTTNNFIKMFQIKRIKQNLQGPVVSWLCGLSSSPVYLHGSADRLLVLCFPFISNQNKKANAPNTLICCCLLTLNTPVNQLLNSVTMIVILNAM